MGVITDFISGLEMDTRFFLFLILLAAPLGASRWLRFIGTDQKKAAPNAWEAHIGAGKRAYLRGRFEEAERVLRAVSIEADGYPPSDPRLLSTLNLLSDTYRNLGNAEKADFYHGWARKNWDAATKRV